MKVLAFVYRATLPMQEKKIRTLFNPNSNQPQGINVITQFLLNEFSSNLVY